MGWGVALASLILTIGPAPGDRVVLRVPIDEAGRIDASALVGRPRGRPLLRVRGLGAAAARALLAQALGPGVSIDVGEDEAVVAIEPRAMRRPGRPRLRARMQDSRRQSRLVSDPPPAYGLFARDSYRPNDPDRPTVCLVHGINSTSDSFRHLIAALEAEGFGVVACEYPYDRDLDLTAEAFARDWRALREARGERRPWSIVTHSMGALVARSYVEGDQYGGDVDHLILIGPTNGGAAVAKVQPLLQVVYGLQAARRKQAGTMGGLKEGLGAAAEDLAPGSSFLEALNRRGRRAGVGYHILAGDAGFLTRADRQKVEARLAAAGRAGGLVGGISRVAAVGCAAALDEMTEGTGDGCVAVASTRLEGVTDQEVVAANHVELIRGPLLYPDPGPIACLPFVLKRLRPGP